MHLHSFLTIFPPVPSQSTIPQSDTPYGDRKAVGSMSHVSDKASLINPFLISPNVVKAELTCYHLDCLCHSTFSVLLNCTIQYSFSADPNQWGANLSPDLVEDDDYLHNPDARTKLKGEKLLFTRRGIQNVGCLVVLMAGLLGLLYVSCFAPLAHLLRWPHF